MKILVVDDCQTTRKLLGLYLKTKGFDVVFAENGLDAIERLGGGDISLIMTDLNMPYMDGIELTRTLRADPNWAHIPILMVTTEADPGDRDRALASGANDYIMKPVTADVIAQRIKRILKDMFNKGGVSDA